MNAIAIVGTGFSGLGMAIRLKQSGFNDFVIFERAHDVGGTWRDNTYPGCACDVESYLYSFSFVPNPSWTRLYCTQPEIWEYLQNCARRFDLLSHIRFNHEVKEARWDCTTQRWRIITTQGKYEARILISAAGALTEPKVPKFPGMENFQGKMIHSARWDHDYDLKGRKVGVIGTGASAIQFVPKIQPQVAQLSIFQRNPPWIVPRFDRSITEKERRLITQFPSLQKLWRKQIYAYREIMGLGFRNPKLMNILKRLAISHLNHSVSDLELRKKLTPNYVMGCKRILISNDYYPSVIQNNVEVVTDSIHEIGKNFILTQNGSIRNVDTIIFGTGFEVTESPYARCFRGKNGRLLAEEWEGSPRSHLGTTVVGYPNFFVLLGPNTGLGHNSVLLMIESQIEHVINTLRFMKKHRIATVEPSTEAEDQFNLDLQSKMYKTVWVTGGCSSWYLDHSGKNATLWPSSVSAFRKRVEPFNPKEYLITKAYE